MLENEREAREDRRVVRSRRRVQEAFLELLAERDFNKITVQEIAERADINRATFYAHFEDKYDLLVYNVRDELHELLQQRLSQPYELTRESLRVLALTIGEFMLQIGGRCQHHNAASAQQPTFMIVAEVQQYVYDLLLDGIGRTSAPREADSVSPECIAAMLSWMLFAGISPLNQINRTPPVDEIVDQMMAFLEPSLAQHIPGFGEG